MSSHDSRSVPWPPNSHPLHWHLQTVRSRLSPIRSMKAWSSLGSHDAGCHLPKSTASPATCLHKVEEEMWLPSDTMATLFLQEAVIASPQLAHMLVGAPSCGMSNLRLWVSPFLDFYPQTCSEVSRGPKRGTTGHSYPPQLAKALSQQCDNFHLEVPSQLPLKCHTCPR